MTGNGRLAAGATLPFRCGLVHRVQQTAVWIGSARHLHHAGLGHLAICAAANRRPHGLFCRSWTRIYAAGLCRARNWGARARPQRPQHQRRFAWSTFRLSDVSKWPLPQLSGMAMGSRTRSGEKHTTSVLVASKHAPATILHKNNIDFSELRRKLPRPLATNLQDRFAMGSADAPSSLLHTAAPR
jgi:hypothetical protein